jgi:RNA polymerase sigma-70 factor (ECF subfamily)
VSRVISNSILDEVRGNRVEITDGGLEGFDLTRIKMVENIYEEPEYSMSETLRLVQYLPSSQKKSIKMYYLDGLQHKEISKILGISVGTSKSNLSKAKKALKRYLVDGVPQNSLKNKYK